MNATMAPLWFCVSMRHRRGKARPRKSHEEAPSTTSNPMIIYWLLKEINFQTMHKFYKKNPQGPNRTREEDVLPRSERSGKMREQRSESFPRTEEETPAASINLSIDPRSTSLGRR